MNTFDHVLHHIDALTFFLPVAVPATEGCDEELPPCAEVLNLKLAAFLVPNLRPTMTTEDEGW
jgi:hypothetical protein